VSGGERWGQENWVEMWSGEVGWGGIRWLPVGSWGTSVALEVSSYQSQGGAAEQACEDEDSGLLVETLVKHGSEAQRSFPG
jgi:hypothetical protein